MTEGIKIKDCFIECDPSTVSDGYHTFGELYDHRCLLFLMLMSTYPTLSFASTKHDDGSEWEGWFIGGVRLDGGMITYHLPDKFKQLIPDLLWLDRAPAWDGHTSLDVLDRLQAELKIKVGILNMERN